MVTETEYPSASFVLPVVYRIDSFPRKKPVYELTFRFKAGEITLSMDLFRMLGIADKPRVDFIKIGSGWYITRSEHPRAYNVVIGHSVRKGKKLQTHAYLANSSFTDHIRQQWGHMLTEVVKVPVLRNPVDIQGLDRDQFPYPLYRLILDQKSVKEQ